MVNDTVRWNYNWYGEKSLGLYCEPILLPNGAKQGAPTISHTDRKIFTLRSGLAYTIDPHHKVLLNHSYYTIDRREFDEMRSEVEQAFVGTRDLQKHIATLSYEMTTLGDRLRSNLFTKFYRQMIDRMDPVLTLDNGEQIRTEERVNSTRKLPVTVSHSPIHYCRNCCCSPLQRRLSECPPRMRCLAASERTL